MYFYFDGKAIHYGRDSGLKIRVGKGDKTKLSQWAQALKVKISLKGMPPNLREALNQ